MCHIIRLLKNMVTLENNLFFFPSLNDGEGDTQKTLRNVSDAIYMLRTRSAGGTGTAIFARRPRVGTNKAVGPGRTAVLWRDNQLVPIIVKS